jgi:hypothetical protein
VPHASSLLVSHYTSILASYCTITSISHHTSSMPITITTPAYSPAIARSRPSVTTSPQEQHAYRNHYTGKLSSYCTITPISHHTSSMLVSHYTSMPVSYCTITPMSHHTSVNMPINHNTSITRQLLRDRAAHQPLHEQHAHHNHCTSILATVARPRPPVTTRAVCLPKWNYSVKWAP